MTTTSEAEKGMTEMRRKMAACVLVVALLVLLVPVQSWAGVWPMEIKKNGYTTPILLVEAQVTVGDRVLLAVNNDNFQWEDEDEMVVDGSNEAFTMEMVRDLGLFIYSPSANPHFGELELVVERGALYIAAEALAPSDGTVLVVGLGGKANGQITPRNFSVIILPSGGGGGQEPGDGNGGEEGGGNEGEEDGNGGEDGSGGGDQGNPGDGGSDGGNSGGDEGDGGSPGGDGDGGSGEDGGNGSDGGDPGSPERPETTEGLTIGGFSEGFSFQRKLESHLSARTGGVIHIPFRAADFNWYDGLGREVEPVGTAVATLAQIKQAGLEVRLAGGERLEVVEAVYLAEEGGSGGVALRLVDRLLSLEDVPFAPQLVVSCNGTSSEGILQGLVEIPLEMPDNRVGWLDLQGGAVIEPVDGIANIQLYLGDGVTMRASLEQGKRYSGIALREAVAGIADDVEAVASLYLLGGLEQRGVFVIESEAERYIYDDEGSYLGVTGQELPYRALYYISTAEPEEDNTAHESGSGSGGRSSGSGGSSSAYRHPTISGAPERFYSLESTTSVTEQRESATVTGNANDNPSTGK